MFCEPGAELVDLESTVHFLANHSDLFSSCGLEYGLIVGQIDQSDPTLWNKRWSLDISAAVQSIEQFMS
jgi:hypothetical protein